MSQLPHGSNQQADACISWMSHLSKCDFDNVGITKSHVAAIQDTASICLQPSDMGMCFFRPSTMCWSTPPVFFSPPHVPISPLSCFLWPRPLFFRPLWILSPRSNLFYLPLSSQSSHMPPCPEQNDVHGCKKIHAHCLNLGGGFFLKVWLKEFEKRKPMPKTSQTALPQFGWRLFLKVWQPQCKLSHPSRLIVFSVKPS